MEDEDKPAVFKILNKTDGVTIEKIEDLSYRVSFGSKSVVFDLNNLRHVKPTAGTMSADERFIGPIFGEFRHSLPAGLRSEAQGVPLPA